MCKCCFGPLEEESCGWPKGTVRAIIALITIPLGFLLAVGLIIYLVIKEEYLVATGINGVVWGAVGTVIGHYFGSRSAEGATKLMNHVQEELIKSRNMEISRDIQISRGIRGIERRHMSDNMDDLSEIVIQE